MIKRYFHEIVQMVDGKRSLGAFGELQIKGVSKDTRTLEPGNLYVPLIGGNYDGHQFVEEAIAKGATASFWQNDHPQPPLDVPLIFVEDTLAALQKLSKAYRSSLHVRIIGVTGSNGKTTTKDMMAAILSTTYKVHKTEGNLNSDIGLPLMLLQLDESTEMAVLEMGMRGRGEIQLLSDLANPEAAIITNVGDAHLERLGSREEIARAKMEIVSGLKRDGLLVYQGDEPLLEQVISEAPLPDSMLRFRFGSSENNDFYPIAVMLDSESKGTHFAINTNPSPSYFIPFLGRHNVINALAAIAVSKYMGVHETDIVKGLKNMQATGMRIEVVKGVSGLTIINDAFNANVTSMTAAIRLLEELKGYDRKMVVLGDMLELGEQEIESHRHVGSLLNPDEIDYVFTYGRLGEHIAEEAGKIFPAERVISLQDKQQVIRHVISAARPEDVVLVKGSRGMKLEEVVQGLKNAIV